MFHCFSSSAKASPVKTLAWSEMMCLGGLGVGIHARQSFQASPANPAREPSGQQGGSDEEGDGGVEDVEVLCHGALSEVWGAIQAKRKGIL